jgi:hypothetical protein
MTAAWRGERGLNARQSSQEWEGIRAGRKSGDGASVPTPSSRPARTCPGVRQRRARAHPRAVVRIRLGVAAAGRVPPHDAPGRRAGHARRLGGCGRIGRRTGRCGGRPCGNSNVPPDRTQAGDVTTIVLGFDPVDRWLRRPRQRLRRTSPAAPRPQRVPAGRSPPPIADRTAATAPSDVEVRRPPPRCP